MTVLKPEIITGLHQLWQAHNAGVFDPDSPNYNEEWHNHIQKCLADMEPVFERWKKDKENYAEYLKKYEGKES
jgi:hypothetical protein